MPHAKGMHSSDAPAIDRDDLTRRQSRWETLISNLEVECDDEGESSSSSSSSGAMVSATPSPSALFNPCCEPIEANRDGKNIGNTTSTTQSAPSSLSDETTVVEVGGVSAVGWGGGNAVNSQPNYSRAGGSIKLTDWIASHRKTILRGKDDNGSNGNMAVLGFSSQKQYLEQLVQILYSLVHEIHGYHHHCSGGGGGHPKKTIRVHRGEQHDDLDGGDGENICIHPNFINIDNVIVHEQTQTADPAAASALDGKYYHKQQTISASFIEWGDSTFYMNGGADDETLKKHLALYALGSMACAMCMMEDGFSLYKLNFPTDNNHCNSESSVNATLNLDKVNLVDDDEHDENDGDDEAVISELKRKKFHTTTSQENDCGGILLKTAMLDAGIPFPFCRFVLDLLDNGHGQMFRSEYSFSSFKDVQSDLKKMIGNPDGFLHGSNLDRWKLIFGDKLYGRDTDMKALIDVADRVASQRDDPIFDGLARLTGKKTEIVMVSGSPGSGKSRLVRTVGKGLEERGWRFMQCKFDRVVHSEPLSIIAHAFDDFLGRYVCCPQQGMKNCSDNSIGFAAAEDRSHIRAYQQLHTSLRRFIRPEGLEILALHIPSLRVVMDVAVPSVLPDVNTAIMTELFSALLKAISSEESPIYFFIDDLQWADSLSLALLMALVRRDFYEASQLSSANGCNQNKHESFNHEQDPYILFVGSYRANSVDDNPPLSKVLNKLQNDDSINMTNILLSGMTVETLNEMLSDSLCIPERRVKSLSELVVQKTDGLPLYVIEFLGALKTDNLLTHRLTRGWEWDEDSIDIFPITESVAELFALKLRRLSKDILLGLQIVSIFGTQVDQQIVDLVKNYDGEDSVDLSAALNVAQIEGLIERAANLISFAHDLIQKATVDSICEDDRVPLLRKLISALIKEASATNSLDSVLFVVVDLINRIGSNLIYCPRERALFAELNSRAGSKAIAVPDFAGAVIYAENGIALLSETCWETQYDLSLRLYETSVLSHFSNNTDDRSKLMARINTICERAKDFSDKFNTHRVWTQVLSMTQLPVAIEQCLVALENLGEPLDLSSIDYIKTCEELLKHDVCFSRETLMSNPLTDSNKEKAMMTMTSLILYYSQRKSFLGAVVSCRMIEMSMNFGYCADTIHGATAFAISLVTCLGDIDGGNVWGRKAMALMKVCSRPNLIPTISASLYTYVFVWKEPFQSSLEVLAEGIRSSFIYGHVEYAKGFTLVYVSRSFHTGKNIRVLTEEVDALTRQHGIRFGDETSSDAVNQFLLLPMSNILRDLQEELDHSSIERRPVQGIHRVDNYELLKVAIGSGNSALLYFLLLLQTAKEFMTRSMDNALKCTDMYFEYFGSKKAQMAYIYIFNVFYDGLINFHFAGRTGDARYRERGENALSQLREWLRHSDWNFQNKLFLVNAEYYKITNDFANAATCYDASIQAAKEHKFIHEEAMANELAGIFYSEQGMYPKSYSHFKQAVACYKKWGASVIAREIETRMEKEFGNESELTTSIDAKLAHTVTSQLFGRTSTKRQF